MLALALLSRPTLSSLAEVHEFAHDPSGQHLDIEAPAAQGNHDERGEQREGQSGDALHTLVHFAHCCGQAATDFPARIVSAVWLVTGDPPASTERDDLPGPRVRTLFRPPITA